MVLTQIIEGGGETEDSVGALLREEYKLLCFGDHMKARFDEYAKACQTRPLPCEFP